MMQWWRRRTLRTRLALWYAAVGTLLVAGFSLVLYKFVATRLAQPLDHELRQDLKEIHRNLRVLPDQGLEWNGQVVNGVPAWMAQAPWFELWDANGTLVGRFWPFNDDRIHERLSAPTPGRETIFVYAAAPDIRLRVLQVAYSPFEGQPPWMMRVFRLHEPAGDPLAELRWIIVISLPVVIALIVIGGYWLTRRWLAPLDRMALEATRITADDLSRRLPIGNPDDELGRLGTVFNVTLDRLEHAFVALDRFVTDASHELRTPLTTLRNVGEVGLRKSRTVEEYREIIGSMLEEAQRLQSLVERLLELAATAGSSTQLQCTTFRVDDFIRSCVGDFTLLAELKNQRISVETHAAEITTDALLLRQALQNLLDNAIKYSPPDSRITVATAESGQRLRISVYDEGPGIDAEDRARLAQRFFRPAAGRARNQGGFGLGLSITQAYMRLLGGTLESQPHEPRGSVFSLLLPHASSALTAAPHET